MPQGPDVPFSPPDPTRAPQPLTPFTPPPGEPPVEDPTAREAPAARESDAVGRVDEVDLAAVEEEVEDEPAAEVEGVEEELVAEVEVVEIEEVEEAPVAEVEVVEAEEVEEEPVAELEAIEEVVAEADVLADADAVVEIEDVAAEERPSGEAPVASAEPAEGQRPSAESPPGPERAPAPPVDLGAWKPIEFAPGTESPQPRAAEEPTVSAQTAGEAVAEASDDDTDRGIAAEVDTGIGAEAEPEPDIAAEIDQEDAELAAEEEAGAAVLSAEAGADDPRAEDEGSRRVAGAAWAFEQALGVASVESQDPPRSAEEVYQRSSAALERLTGIRPDAAWLEAEDIEYGSGRSLESSFAESRDGSRRAAPQALEVALGMAARGERVDDDLVAEAATAAVSVLHEALRSIGTTSGARGSGDLFEDGATEAFIALHAEEWLGQLGFYDAFPGAQADPQLSGERLARTYTWQTVAARGYLERFASAAGRLPGSVVDDFVKGGGGTAGLNRLHLDYLRSQRREGVEPDVEAEAIAAQRMTADALRLVSELAAGGLRDPASAGTVAAGIADQVMAGIAVAG